jgi:hypothetical protein
MGAAAAWDEEHRRANDQGKPCAQARNHHAAYPHLPAVDHLAGREAHVPDDVIAPTAPVRDTATILSSHSTSFWAAAPRPRQDRPP